MESAIVSIVADRPCRRMLHPVHAALLAGTIPLFLGTTLSDFAYASSYQVQWANFSSWLIVGGLLFGGLALLWAVIDLFRAERRVRSLVYVLLLLVAWILGLVNAFIHARDAWASMPTGLVLSVIVTVLVVVATGLGFAGFRAGGAK